MPETVTDNIYLQAQSFSLSAVDEKAGIVRGYVIAETGLFREPDPRGQFSLKSLRQIEKLMNADPDGVRVNLDHESFFESNLLRYLGRSRNIRLDGSKLRGDLHFDDSASNLPGLGDVRSYLMKRIKSDPNSLSSSLVITKLQIEGNDDVPVWIPQGIQSSDIVSMGAAVGAILSANRKPVKKETPVLDKYRKCLWRMQERVEEFSSSGPALLAAR